MTWLPKLILVVLVGMLIGALVHVVLPDLGLVTGVAIGIAYMLVASMVVNSIHARGVA